MNDIEEALVATVVKRVAILQDGYLKDQPSAVRTLATLRQSLSRGGISDPGVWEVVFTDLPVELVGRGDDPSRAEQVLHACLTTFAIHQQGRAQRMHRSGQSLGRAVRDLAAATNENATLRRFKALGTTSTWAETLHHLRGLVRQMRGAGGTGISLDYGRLARDLYRLQRSRTATQVRLAWGRDFHRRPSAGEPGTDQQGSASAEKPEQTVSSETEQQGDHP